MKAQWLKTFGSIAGLAAASLALAQEDPPKQEDPPEQEEEEVLPVRWNSLTVGYSTWDASGNRRRMFQYARPPEGLTLYELSLFSPWTDGTHPYGRLDWRGTPGQDTVGQGRLIFNQGNTMLTARTTQFSHFEPTWLPVSESNERVTQLTAQHTFAPDIGAYYVHRSESQAERFPAPLPNYENRTYTNAAGVEGKVLGGQAGVVVSDHRFLDDSGFQPATLQRRVAGHYVAELGSMLSLEGQASYTRIEQAGRPNSHVRSLALAGNWDLGPATTFQFNLGQQELDLNVVQNAYVQQRFNTQARLIHRWPGWSFQLGFRHREYERVRADRSFVDVPKWNTYDARLYGRLNDSMRFTLRGSWEDQTGDAVMNTLDPRPLYWGDRAMVQAKVDGGNDRLTGYGSYTFRYRRNADRNVDVRWHNFAIGGSYVFTPELLGYAEFAYDNFAASGVLEGNSSLDFYFPDSTSLALGVDWARSPLDSVSASLNFFETNNFRGTQLTMQYRRQLSADHSLDLVVAPWRFEDRLFGLSGFNATFMQIRYTVRY